MSDFNSDLRKETVELDGITYTTTQYPYVRHAETLVELVQFASPVLGMLKGLNLSELQKAEPEAILKALPMLEDLLKKLEPGTFTYLMLRLLGGTRVEMPAGTDRNGKPLPRKKINITDGTTLDQVFSGPGGFKRSVLVAVHALKVNYVDFFGEGSVGAPMTSSTPDPEPPTEE